jgi:hypothetical protein
MSAIHAFDTATGAVISTLTKPGGNINKEYNFVAISGTTAVAGAQLEGVGGTAYLFDVPTGTVLATVSNPSADPDGGDNFGAGVAISGGTVVIGAPGDDGADGDGNTGRAYVWPRLCVFGAKLLQQPDRARRQPPLQCRPPRPAMVRRRRLARGRTHRSARSERRLHRAGRARRLRRLQCGSLPFAILRRRQLAPDRRYVSRSRRLRSLTEPPPG